MEENVNIVPETGKRGEAEDNLVKAFKNTNLIKLLADFYGADEGICVNMIKASVNHGADYLDVALKDFISNH